MTPRNRLLKLEKKLQLDRQVDRFDASTVLSARFLLSNYPGIEQVISEDCPCQAVWAALQRLRAVARNDVQEAVQWGEPEPQRHRPAPMQFPPDFGPEVIAALSSPTQRLESIPAADLDAAVDAACKRLGVTRLRVAEV